MHTLNGSTYKSATEAVGAIIDGYASMPDDAKSAAMFALAAQAAQAAQVASMDGVDNIPDGVVGVLLQPKDRMAVVDGVDLTGHRLFVTDLPYISADVEVPPGAVVVRAVDEVSLLASLGGIGVVDYRMG